MARGIDERVEQAAKRLAELKAAKAKADARKKADAGKERRKLDNKKKILLGAYMLDRMERDDSFQAKVMPRLDKFLVRPADRSIFGLPPMPTSPPPGSSDAA
jgi:large subunit ribosomal protein L7/L12